MKKEMIAFLLCGLAVVSNGEIETDDLLTKETSSAVLDQYIAEVNTDLVRAGLSLSKMNKPLGYCSRFKNSGLWGQIDLNRGNPEIRIPLEMQLANQLSNSLAQIHMVQREAYAVLYLDWTREHFVPITKKQLTWNSDSRNWSFTPNNYGGKLQQVFMARLNDHKTRIIELKSYLDQHNGDDSILGVPIELSNRIAKSNLWIQFWNPKKDIVDQTVVSMTRMLGNLDAEIRSIWLPLHPEIKAVIAKAKAELATKTQMAEMKEDAIRQANAAAAEKMAAMEEKHKREIRDLEDQIGGAYAAAAEANEAAKRATRRANAARGEVDDTNRRLDRARDEFQSKTGEWVDW